MSNTENTPTEIQKLELSPDLDDTFSNPIGAEIIPFPEGGRDGNQDVHYDGDPTPPKGMPRPKEVPPIDDDFSRNIEAIATETVDSDHPVIQRHREIEIKEREDDLNQMKPRLAGREPGEYKAAKLALKALNEADMDRSSEDAFNKGLVDKLGSPPDDNKLREL